MGVTLECRYLTEERKGGYVNFINDNCFIFAKLPINDTGIDAIGKMIVLEGDISKVEEDQLFDWITGDMGSRKYHEVKFVGSFQPIIEVKYEPLELDRVKEYLSLLEKING
jgi:hypothetical protein